MPRYAWCVMFLLRTDWRAAPKPGPHDQVLFAIGDIHGRSDLLSTMHHVLRREIPGQGRPVQVIRIGDFIDRGPDPIATLRLAAAGLGLDGVQEVNLRGNHEQMLMDIVGTTAGGLGMVSLWLANGGDAVLRAVDRAWAIDPALQAPRMRDILLDAIPADCLAFLSRLGITHQAGRIVFVHAGVDPQQPIDETSASTLMWIRGRFLRPDGLWAHDFAVVHGHTVAPPEVLPHRIGIDTGAYLTGALTSVQIDGGRLRFLVVSETPTLEWPATFPEGPAFLEPEPIDDPE